MKMGFEPKAPSTTLVRVWHLDLVLFLLWMLIQIGDYILSWYLRPLNKDFDNRGINFSVQMGS